MSVETRWLGGRRLRRHRALRSMSSSYPIVTIDFGNAQPVVSTINDNGEDFVGLHVEVGNVYVELRVEDPKALRDELDEALSRREA